MTTTDRDYATIAGAMLQAWVDRGLLLRWHIWSSDDDFVAGYYDRPTADKALARRRNASREHKADVTFRLVDSDGPDMPYEWVDEGEKVGRAVMRRRGARG